MSTKDISLDQASEIALQALSELRRIAYHSTGEPRQLRNIEELYDHVRAHIFGRANRPALVHDHDFYGAGPLPPGAMRSLTCRACQLEALGEKLTATKADQPEPEPEPAQSAVSINLVLPPALVSSLTAVLARWTR